MAGTSEPDGKNSLLGEFLLSLARAPEPIQEAIIMHGMKQMVPYASSLIHPYPMLNHMLGILQRPGSKVGGAGSSNDNG